jgi:hypothetical protein
MLAHHTLSFSLRYVASVTEATVTAIDIQNPANPKVIATIKNATWLYYSTHLSFDPLRSVLFVVSAGNGSEPLEGGRGVAGHSITSVAVAENGTMALVDRMTDWTPGVAPSAPPGSTKTMAYPVYSTLDPERPVLYVSNDAQCTVDIIDVSTLTPRKMGNYTSCAKIAYNSQSGYDPLTRRLFTACQHANSFAVVDVSHVKSPKLVGLIQDRNRTSKDQPLAGATGCAFDGSRNLSFVASE